MTDDPTWETGPWLVEVRRRYVVDGCSSHTAVRAVRATLNGTKLPIEETMPQLTESETRIVIFPEGNTPFPDGFLEGEA